MEKLKEHGWYLTDQGFKTVSDNGTINEFSKIIKRALDLDLREIGSGEGDIAQGNLVLQIQKLRNVSAPKNNEESKSAPRMLKLYLTDGKNNFQAVEIENISAISLNTSPGTKLLLNPGNIVMSHGIILLRPANIACVLGGRVPNLIEKWELNRKLASHTRVRSSDEGGPPPWIPFGKKILRTSDNNKNFKALADKENSGKDNSEFEAQRQDAIAEAARQGSKKVFGGGNKQLLDHTVQRIVEHGFSIEQAEYALKVNRNNVDRALKSLQRNDIKHNTRDAREQREPRGKRFEKKTEETKPSSGKVSLFDFLENKLPAQSDHVDTTTQYNNENFGNSQFDNQIERNDYRGDGSFKGGRTQKGGRGGYQAPPRYSDDMKSKRNNHENYNSLQHANNSQQGKPPRFQKNQDSYHHHGKLPQTNERYKNSTGNTRNDFHNNTNEYSGNHSKNPKNQSDSNNRYYSQLDGETSNKQKFDTYHSKQNRSHLTNSSDKSYNKNEVNHYQTNDINVNNIHRSGHKNVNDYNNTNRNNMSNGTWVWKKGDKCMAKYWEDNKYYNAEVTAVSTRTCVVQFKDFNNYEEVLQVDCIPITEDISHNFPSMYPEDHRRQEHRGENRTHQRHDQGHNLMGNMEFRRSNPGGGSGNTRGFNKKRTQQRSSQPIYQPPAQRR